MLSNMLLALSIFLFTVAALLFGYIMGLEKKIKDDQDDSKFMYYYPPGADILTDSPTVMRKPIKQKPGGIFSDEKVPSGPVNRPSVEQLNEWKKDKMIKDSEEEMRKTFQDLNK